jgi:CRISPR-associated protein Cmr2
MTSPSETTALLTVSIGPVQTFIAQARRFADLWTGSHLLSHLVARAIEALPGGPASVIFPALARVGGTENVPPGGLPNRFVARIPAADAKDVVISVADAVQGAWSELLDEAEEILAPHGLAPDQDQPQIRRSAEQAFEIAWSWVPESGDYAAAAASGARRFAASRVFRPFPQRCELGEKCAICGERTALPDGVRSRVRERWQRVAADTKGTDEDGLFRFDQSRLCLVCATKRVYAHPEDRRIRFRALDEFQAEEHIPYIALVQLDGDRMGRILGWEAKRLTTDDVEAFHRALSGALRAFADQLSSAHPPDLDTDALRISIRGHRNPQLIYAGGDDVLLVCDPRDALPIARSLEQRYRATMADELSQFLTKTDLDRITLSGAVVIAHTRQPAGLTLRDAATLLKDKAKTEAGRNALAIRLDKRGGVPVETAFHWDDGPEDSDQTWLEALDGLVEDLRAGRLSSGQTFNLRQEEHLLRHVFAPDDWQAWLTDRLSRSRTTSGIGEGLAARIAPFFVAGRSEALRIVRFLGRELEQQERHRENVA